MDTVHDTPSWANPGVGADNVRSDKTHSPCASDFHGPQHCKCSFHIVLALFLYQQNAKSTKKEKAQNQNMAIGLVISLLFHRIWCVVTGCKWQVVLPPAKGVDVVSSSCGMAFDDMHCLTTSLHVLQDRNDII